MVAENWKSRGRLKCFTPSRVEYLNPTLEKTRRASLVRVNPVFRGTVTAQLHPPGQHLACTSHRINPRTLWERQGNEYQDRSSLILSDNHLVFLGLTLLLVVACGEILPQLPSSCLARGPAALDSI